MEWTPLIHNDMDKMGIITSTRGTQDDEDIRLRDMGYRPELVRSMSTFSMLGLAFSVLSSWGELGSSLTSGITAGGPVVLFYGWLGVSACSLAVVVSLAEICSAYPTNAGQYYWVAILGGRRVSYITAWAQVVGLIGVGAAAVANVAESAFGMAELVDAGFEERTYKTVLECWAIIVLACTFNIYGRRALSGLGVAALVWGVGGLLITIITLLSTAEQFQPPKFVFTEFSNDTGLPDTLRGVVICLGLTNLSYVYTAYESPAHLVEEMNNAQEDAPKAMVWSVYLGFLTGLIYLLTILFCITDLSEVVASDNPIFPIYYQATQSYVGSCILGTVLLITQVFAEFSFIAETSRTIMAFARDRGLPFSDLLARVDPTYKVPINAIILTGACQALVMAIYFGSSTAFLTILAIGTVGLYFSYAMAISYRLLDRFNDCVFRAGPYAVRPILSMMSNVVAIIFLIFEITWFFVPTRYPVTVGNMNYMVLATFIVIIIGLASWRYSRDGYAVTGNIARECAKGNEGLHARGDRLVLC